MLTIGPKIERTLPWRSALGRRPAVAVEPRSGGRDGLSAWLPRHLSIRLALAATFGVIIAVTATALILALESGRQNTIDLVRDRSDRIIGAILERTRSHLEPARDQSRFIARLVADGALDPRDEADFTSHLSAALAGTPQVSALAVIRTDLRQLRVERQGDAVVARSIDMKTVPGLQEAFEMAKNGGQPLWGELLWSERLSQPLVNIRTPLWREGSFIGILLTTVTVTELSAFLGDSAAQRSAGAFILYGREQVLAHAALARAHSLFKPDRPLPAIAEVGDPVLAAIWGPQRDLEMAATLSGASGGHVVDVKLIGRYMPLEELGSEVRRLERATWIGLASVLAAVAGAWLVGYALGQPILRLARATAAIRDLDLSSARWCAAACESSMRRSGLTMR